MSATYATVLESAWAQIRRALDGRPLVILDRFSSAGRTWTTSVHPGPALAAGRYDSWPAAGQHPTLALERLLRRRVASIRHDWLTLLAPAITWHLTQAGDRVPVFYCWYETPAIRQLATDNQGQILAHPTTTRAILENKTAFGDIMRNAQVPPDVYVPSIVVDTSTPADFSRLRRAFETDTIVVQTAHDSGGRGTHFVSDATAFAAAAVESPVKVAPFVPGPSSNMTVLTVPETDDRCSVYVDGPSANGIAVTALGIGTAKSAGNDWSVRRPAAHVARLVDAAERIGSWAYRTHRLVGLWGIDVIWSPDGPVINEINCRVQGTTEVSSANQLLRGLPPLALAHIATMLRTRPGWLPTADDFNAATIATVSTRHRAGPYYIKVRATHPGDGATTTFRGSGAYHLDLHGHLTWRRNGTNALDADTDTNEILIANAAQPGTACDTGAEICTIEGTTTLPIFTSAGDDLSARGTSIVTAVRDVMGRP